MKISKLLFGGTLFKKVFPATKRDVLVSLCVLVFLSVLCSLLLWKAEWNHTNYSIGDALLWPFVMSNAWNHNKTGIITFITINK